MSNDNFTSVVGVVADVRWGKQNDYKCTRCCVYGIDASEHAALSARAEIHPVRFHPSANRYVVHQSPWAVMRVLGSMGYYRPVTPLDGRVGRKFVGERRTVTWTMVRTKGPMVVNEK